MIRGQPEDTLLTLTNVKDARFNYKVVDAMKDFVVHNKPYVRKGAVIGVKGLQKIIYDAILKFSRRVLPRFDDFDKAKDWLVDIGETERVKLTTHKEKQVLYLDFLNYSMEEARRTIKESKRIIGVQPENSLLTLANIADGHFDSKTAQEVKNFVLYIKRFLKRCCYWSGWASKNHL